MNVSAKAFTEDCRLLDKNFPASACAHYVFCTIIQKHAMRCASRKIFVKQPANLCNQFPRKFSFQDLFRSLRSLD